MTKAFERPANVDTQLCVQPPLFDAVKWSHDYGGDEGGDFGHEFPFVRGSVEKKSILPQIEQGVSVTFEERRLALEAMARVYGRHNRGEGMRKAASSPTHRPYLERRYRDVDYVAERAELNGQYTNELERTILQPLLKEKKLIDAGFIEADVDLNAISIIHSIRQELGVTVRADVRKKNLKQRTNR